MRTTNKIIEDGEKDPKALARIRYRICRLAKDIIQMEEILSYLLEALEVIEIPPEPPEQAGRALYERLEIAGMRNQLVRRAMDLKKNVAGSSRFLDVLREMSAVVSESKLFQLNESVDLNTKRMCLLQDSNERTANAVQLLMGIFAGVLSFSVLDRITGPGWNTATAPWFASTYQSLIQNTAGGWFIINLIVWGVIMGFVYWLYRKNHYIAQGITTVRLKINRKVFVDRVRKFLDAKVRAHEERVYNDHVDIVKVTYTDNLKRDWGGAKPTVTLEYDDRNCFLLTVTVQYNKREAKKALVFTPEELKEKIMDELNLMDVWDVKGEDVSAEDLAQDKRLAIERMIQDEEEADEANQALGAAAAEK
jgi:WD repeat-containing protein 35